MQIYLIAPDTDDTAIKAAMETGLVAALLVLRQGTEDASYAKRLAGLAPVAQTNSVAVLAEDAPELVRPSGIDGAHLSGGITEFTAAAKTLKPEFIAGAGDLRSRHEAMLRGEAGADYLMFGSFDAAATAEDRELAEWWSELFEPPAALSDPVTALENLDAAACEFIVLGGNVWSHSRGAVAALELAATKFGAGAS